MTDRLPAKMVWEGARGMTYERFEFWYNAMIDESKPKPCCIKKNQGDGRFYVNSSDPRIKRYIADNNPEYDLVKED